MVVLSYRNDETVLAAVDSLLDQSEPVEVVVSHSGGGPTPERLRRERPSVRVDASEARRSCSHARNAGIRACAAAVASAVTNAYPHSRSAWASHLLRYQRRFVQTPEADRLMLGVSCHRDVFERMGLFRDDLPGAEDSEFTERLLAEVDVAWAGNVRSAHRNAATPADLVRDHFRRGVRNARARTVMDGGPRTLAAAGEALVNVPRALVWAGRLGRDGGGVHPFSAAPLLAPATAAYLAGLVAGRRAGP